MNNNYEFKSLRTRYNHQNNKKSKLYINITLLIILFNIILKLSKY